MKKLKRVYICDMCGDVKLPRTDVCGLKRITTRPVGWIEVDKKHFCQTCYPKYYSMRKGLTNNA